MCCWRINLFTPVSKIANLNDRSIEDLKLTGHLLISGRKSFFLFRCQMLSVIFKFCSA